MARYDDNWSDQPQRNMQRDLVLSTNEFCFLQSKTNGAIKTYTGPITMTISQQESLVVFNSRTKKFEGTDDFERAKQLFVSAPEGWYVVLIDRKRKGKAQYKRASYWQRRTMGLYL